MTLPEPMTASTARALRRSAARSLVLSGKSNKEIALSLGVAESTVSRWSRALPLPARAEVEHALAPFARLTAGERAVLVSAATGAGARDIAQARGTSPRSVTNQLRAAYLKLGIGSRRELRTLAARGRKN